MRKRSVELALYYECGSATFSFKQRKRRSGFSVVFSMAIVRFAMYERDSCHTPFGV